MILFGECRISTNYQFCLKCGSIKIAGNICKICTNIIKTTERTAFIQKQNVALKKSIIIKSKYIKPNKYRKTIRYSIKGGLEWDIDEEPSFNQLRTKLNTCIKCKQLKKQWEGRWVRAGGRYSLDDDHEVPIKRIFLCGKCWKPKPSF